MESPSTHSAPPASSSVRQEGNFRELVENLPDVISRFDKNLRLIYVNSAAQRYTGIDPKEIIGKNPSELGGELEKSATENIRTVFQTGKTLKAEYEMSTQKGKKFFQTLIVPEFGPDGNVETVLTVTRDISDHAYYEHRLLEAEKKYRHVIDNAGDFIYTTDLSGYFRDANGSALEVCGYPIEELRQYKYLDLILPEHRQRIAMQYMRQYLKRQNSLYVEFPFVIKNGSVRWFGQHSTLIYEYGEPVGFHIIAHDITDRKLAEQKLAQANVELEQQVKARTIELEKTLIQLREALSKERELGELKTRFVSMVSHELRTPLTAILSNTEILKEYSEFLDTEKRNKLHDGIIRSVRYMTKLLEEVLVLGNAENKRPFRPEPLDILQLCREIIAEQKNIFPGRIIFLHCAESLPALMLDEALVRSILVKLMTNALNYSSKDAPVELDVELAEDKIYLKVLDHGTGIDDDEQKHLFEPFFRGKDVDTISGTGLGLAIARQNVEQHGGKISFFSEKGHGSTFIVELPAVQAYAEFAGS